MPEKAALFGINDYKFVNSLRGCVNDVENMRSLLVEVLGFDEKNVRTFVNNKVTKTEINRQMKWLFRDVAAGDRVVFHVSGHGSQTADLDGDEHDGADELFCLYDMDFNDPESYLLDDELREWTKSLPTGVQLTVILDTCHSGTGTRMLLSPESNKPHLSMSVDVEATIKRSISTAGPGARGIQLAAAALDPRHEDIVRARFVDPPPSVKQAIAAQARIKAASGSRALVEADINHVLIAACKDDQTAADATIEGNPNGAFTYYLCKTLRSCGGNIDRKSLIDNVEQALAAAQFNQIPQLEAAGNGVLFGAKVGGVPSTSTVMAIQPVVAEPTRVVGHEDQALDVLASIVGLGGNLDSRTQKQALDILQRLVGGASTADKSAVTSRGPGDRLLVAVHGICKHPHGFSNPWWDALKPFTTVFGDGTLDVTRLEVLWSDIVNQRGLRNRRPYRRRPRRVRRACSRRARGQDRHGRI